MREVLIQSVLLMQIAKLFELFRILRQWMLKLSLLIFWVTETSVRHFFNLTKQLVELNRVHLVKHCVVDLHNLV